MLRACLVSTEEQKKHGYSIQAQKDKLQNYIDAHADMMLVDFYIDDGVSAVKVGKRLALQRLLQDVKDGKIDLILFTKLDRWGRSVGIYYQIQSVLDEYGVIWKAIDEDYEIETSAGKFKVNIMMSVAQQERDRCSERIKDAFEYKLKNGEALFGSAATPIGFKVENKQIYQHLAACSDVLFLCVQGQANQADHILQVVSLTEPLAETKAFTPGKPALQKCTAVFMMLFAGHPIGGKHSIREQLTDQILRTVIHDLMVFRKETALNITRLIQPVFKVNQTVFDLLSQLLA